MGDEEKKISDLPSHKELAAALPLAELTGKLARLSVTLGLGGEGAQKFADQTDDLLRQAEILELPDQFNAALSERGWLATSSLSVDVLKEALAFAEAGEYEKADEAMIRWLTPDTINLFAITRSKNFGDVHGRWHQLREALALTEEERYWSAVPLILIAADGFASDVLGTSPFEKNADLSAFDSIVAHPTALPKVISGITKGVRKSSDDEMGLPRRHGILHGRSLGYANKLVCAKAWMLMIALVDWAIDKRDEETRRTEAERKASTSWSDIAKGIRKNSDDRKALDAFQPMEWLPPFGQDLPKEEPPFAFLEFFTGWKTKNYGLMGGRAVNLLKKPLGKMAGDMRRDTEFMELEEFDIKAVTQTTVARAEARVFLRGKSLKGQVEGEFIVPAFRNTAEGDVAMPTDEGHWQVQQGIVFNLMHQRGRIDG